MAIEILMPALSPTMEEGTIARWLVKEGDKVSAGDILAEIETDKATMEFEAVDEGVLAKILVPEGSTVKVNTPIAILAEEGEDVAEVASGATSSAAGPGTTAGAAVSVTDEEGAAEPASEPETEPQPQPVASSRTVTGASGRIFATPLARRLAKEFGVDLAAIKGSGPRGRIVKADVLAAAEAQKAAGQGAGDMAAPVAASAPAASAPRAPVEGEGALDAVRALYADRPHEEVALDNMRRTIARRLVEAKQTIPHFYLRRDIHLDALLALRKEMNAALGARGVKLSVNDFIIKAAALALQEVPECNAVWAGDRIIRLKPSDVAVAVAVEGGLFTPVIRDAEKKSLSAISAEMKDLAERARARRLKPEEYQGGSFAISNLGMYGIDNFDAVINPPHGSILAVGAGVKKPVVNPEGEIVPATVMSVTLSVDHRVIDGALGARFLAAIKSHLENPLAMLA